MDDLIDSLVKDLRPVSRHALSAYLALALLIGLAGAAIILLVSFGFRPGIHQAATVSAFWIKFSYNALLMLGGIIAIRAIAVPGGSTRKPMLMLAGCFVTITAVAIVQLWLSPVTAYGQLVFGISARLCSLLIMIFAVPAFTANFWFLRRAAPTDPTAAGFFAGLSSGAMGAWVYSWACVENGMPFIALWYTLGILLTAVVGAVMGKYWLRW